MTNPYNVAAMPQGNYPAQVNYQDYQQPVPVSRGITTGDIVKSATAGMLVGGGVGYWKYRLPVKDGKVSDEFVKQAYEKYVDSCSDNKKTIVKELKKLLKGIDKAKSPEDLKKLLTDNKTASEHIYLTFPIEDVKKNINADNINTYKSKIGDISLNIH